MESKRSMVFWKQCQLLQSVRPHTKHISKLSSCVFSFSILVSYIDYMYTLYPKCLVPGVFHTR